MSSVTEKYISAFKNPAREFRPVSMWFWTGKLKKDEITFQLEQFKSQGMNDVFVNAAFGMDVEYLSDEFFEYVKYTVSECKRLDMNYWIYDELNWPSGNAGGKLLSEYPWAVGKILKCDRYRAFDELESLENGRIARFAEKGEFIRANLIFDTPEGHEIVDVSDKVLVEKTPSGETVVTYQNFDFCCRAQFEVYFSIPDPYIIWTSIWNKDSKYEEGYIDTFNKEATLKFIELTHEKYKEAIGEEFGKTVKGVFTDEVCLASPFSLTEKRLPWSDHFAKKFKELKGYDLEPELFCLFNECDDPHVLKVRNDYFNAAKEIYLESFMKPMYDWCDKNNLLFTGHFDGEESFIWNLLQSGDMLTSFKYMHIPGIDSIVSGVRIVDKNYDSAGKVLNSVAKHYNRDRALCETYTCSGWDMRFDTMKRVANRLFTLGINMIHYMGATYSYDSYVKNIEIGGTPSFGYNNPMWCHFHKLNDYDASVQAVSAMAKGGSKALFMTPLVETKSIFEGHKNFFHSHKPDYKISNLDEIYWLCSTGFMKLGIDLDFVSEDDANNIKAENGVMEFCGYRYEYMILPGMEHIDKNTACLIKRLMDAGVKIIFVNSLPKIVVDADIAALPCELGNEKLVFENSDASLSYFENENNCIVKIKERTQNDKTFAEVIGKAFKPEDRSIDAKTTGNIYIGHRENAEVDIYLMANDDNFANEIRIPKAMKGIEILCPDTRDYKEVYFDGNDIVIPLEAYELVIIIKSKSESFDAKAIFKAPEKESEVISLEKGFTFVPELENQYRCRWKYNYNGKFYAAQFFTHFPAWVPLKQNMPYELKWDVKIDSMPDALFLNGDVSEVEEVLVNGSPVKISANTRIWGPENFRTEITSLLHEGENEIICHGRTPDFNCVFAVPVFYLSGDFKLDNDFTVSKLASKEIALGSIDTQGYKNFAGKASYKNTFNGKKGLKTVIEINTREAVTVKINGNPIDVIMWEPRKADVTEFVKDGVNEIELEITTTYQNLLSLFSENNPANHGIYEVKVITY